MTETPAAVIAGVDGSENSIDAVRWAAGHARAIGAELRLVHAVRTPASATVALPVPVSVTVPARRPARPADRVLAQAAAEAELFAPGLTVSGEVASGGALEALVEASDGAALLVLGSRGLGRLSGTLSGSVGVQVVAQAHCPTVVVRGPGDPDGPVVVAVDGTEASEPALAFAFAEAARRRARLIAVHAWAPPVTAVGAGHAVVHTMAVDLGHTELRRSAELVLTEAMASWRASFPDVDVVEAVVEKTALTERTSGAALMVVGSRGRGRLSGLLLGSTSQGLLAHAECPVAVVREP